MQKSAVSGAAATLRDLPSVDEVLRTADAGAITETIGAAAATRLARSVIDRMRNEIRDGGQTSGSSKGDLLTLAATRLVAASRSQNASRLGRVINATGVIVHTNLGRAPLSKDARRAIADEASAYCSLEYDLETGGRGKRGIGAERLLAELMGAGDSLIVNNCAAAAFFVLTVFGSGGEVVISRGELVEIGGDFRVPDVLAQSNATLSEVGTTNRTKLADYEKAIGAATRLLLRVHPSNYRIVGFTATPSLRELADLAHARGILLYEDLGSGALIDLTAYGIAGEPLVAASIAAGVDIVTFSGDKLLGGPQAGIIAGKRELIEKLRRHPLYRALRVDKLTLAALEATLGAYARGTAVDDVPIVRMIAMTKDELDGRAAAMAERLAVGARGNDLIVETIDGRSVIGGGAAPEALLETKLIAISHPTLSAAAIESRLRAASPPVIARIEDDRVLIDLRTVPETDEPELLAILSAL